jgi:FkbM family methyltransferase
MYAVTLESAGKDNYMCQKLPSSTYFVPTFDHAETVCKNGADEKAVIDWVVNSYLKSEKDFVDIGASLGTFTIPAAEKAHHVHSFECSPKIYNYLCATIACHDLHTKITAHKIALGSSPGTIPYYDRGVTGVHNGTVLLNRDIDLKTPFTTVPVRTLDSFELSNVNVIKIDTEGAENEVFLGAKNTIIENDYPVIFFESWDPWRDREGRNATELRTKLFDTVRSLNYKITPLFYPEMFIATRHV